MIVAPPLLLGAEKATDSWPLPAVIPVIVGAPGVETTTLPEKFPGVTELD